ncbi:hypothetical protein HZD82_23235, partial [Pantoea agglomerans]|nr:hypothetical protein [Pantoea agglomerans]
TALALGDAPIVETPHSEADAALSEEELTALALDDAGIVETTLCSAVNQRFVSLFC